VLGQLSERDRLRYFVGVDTVKEHFPQCRVQVALDEVVCGTDPNLPAGLDEVATGLAQVCIYRRWPSLRLTVKQ
jgi:hypothetical protein